MPQPAEGKRTLFRLAFLKREKHSCRRGAVLPQQSRLPFLTLTLWLLFIGTLFYALFFSSWLTVTTVEMRGQSVIPYETIETSVWEALEIKRFLVFRQKNILVVNTNALSHSLQARYPKFESITVERVFPHLIRIFVSEKPFVVEWCSGGPCFLLDNDGATVSAIPAEENVLYQNSLLTLVDNSALPIALGESLPIQSILEKYSKLMQTVPQFAPFTLMREAQMPSRYARELRIPTSEGWALLINLDRPIEETLGVLDLLLKEALTASKRQELQTLDLRTEGRVFLGYKTIKEEVVMPVPDTTKRKQSTPQQP